jgi:hypothetical protein
VPDDALEILKLRAELVELGSAVRQLRQAGLDSATAQLLLTRKRAELEDVMCRRKDAAPVERSDTHQAAAAAVPARIFVPPRN